MSTNLVEIFYIIDEFCKEIEKTMEEHNLVKDTSIKKRNRAFTMSNSEVITIMIMFHQNHYRDLKAYYINYIQLYRKKNPYMFFITKYFITLAGLFLRVK